MITGTSMKKKKIKSNKYYKTLDGIINYELTGTNCDAPQYIKDTFNAFVNQKVQIIINLHQINRYFYGFKHLILKKNNKNELKNVVVKLFRKSNKLIIYTTNGIGQKTYEFDILSVLPIIKMAKKYRNYSKTFKIAIKATHKYTSKLKYMDVSWIHKEWVKSKALLENRFNQKGYDITWKSTLQKGDVNLKEDTLLIKS
eukprot:226441_1